MTDNSEKEKQTQEETNEMPKESKKIPEEGKEIPKGLMPENIYELIKYFLTALAAQVWIYLGLIYNPQTNKITQDLAQAKIGIDCFEFLLNKIKNNLREKEVKELTEVLNNLQLNFIEKTKSEN